MNGLYPLQDNQVHAVDPVESVWLSASAGTGKTQVLSSRVLRLLLQEGVDPSQVLCLTFTKAGAAEMAVRVNEVLARWVRMSETDLAKDLNAIGADVGERTRGRARTLFARVLDCPGGGLRIDTIHAFAQWLLSAFPEEAGLLPGARAMEDRDRDLLAREVLADLLVQARDSHDVETLTAVEALAMRMGPDGVQAWLTRCAGARDLWLGPGSWMPPLKGRVKRLLGLAEDEDASSLALLCADDAFDVRSLRHCLATYGGWKTKTGEKSVAAIGEWLSASLQERFDGLGALQMLLVTAEELVRNRDALDKIDPDCSASVERVAACIKSVLERKALLELAEWLAPALSLGRRFALAWDEAKQREGLIDFDDQIRHAADLLERSELSDWIRYKLDRRFDHILIDEAQDTNEPQWNIVFALIGDYFSGEGARDGKIRTLFTVGDYKQAIFRFQGTSPENFEAARRRVKTQMAATAANAAQLRERTRASELVELGLERSYRTSQPVLDFVNLAMERLGHQRFGLQDKPDDHRGDQRPGLVSLWQVIGGEAGGVDDEDVGDQKWLSRPDRMLAEKIARQVKHWMDTGYPLHKGIKPGATPRRAGPGDIMILVRKRKELAGLIVARLYAAGVPVAGVDRLRLGAPLAVKDLLAALRFAAQPLDDLNLANLLMSPLVGWSQQQLLDHGWRTKGMALWSHLRASPHPDVIRLLDRLGGLLSLADFEPPQALLHWLLVGPWQGRRRLVARLGREVNDPINELLNAAMAYSAAHTPSLQGFLRWFDAGDGELKREAGASDGLVRVMTVHGSKGLQAPIVILADAAGNPKDSRMRDLVLREEGDEAIQRLHTVPLPSLSKAERFGRVAEEHAKVEAEEMQEHWRLLYVAMTRAEESLFIAGSLSAREDKPSGESWYGQLAPLFSGDDIDDPIWGSRKDWGQFPMPLGTSASLAKEPVARTVLPNWAADAIGPEPRPPRPLAPSSAADDRGANPPVHSSASEAAARRGTLIHALLERLPELAPADRADAAMRWLEHRAGDLALDEREEMLSSVLQVLDAPHWADLFSPTALAEVPVAAVVDGQVIAGTIDRLLVTPDRVLVADFKTARRPPVTVEGIPASTLRQMAAYVAALARIYPGRLIEAAVLYTQTPQLIALSAEVLELHKPGLPTHDESFP